MTTASQSASQSQITALEATQTSSTGEVDKLRKRVDNVTNLVGVINRLKYSPIAIRSFCVLYTVHNKSK